MKDYATRLADLGRLREGSHAKNARGEVCIMEAVAYVAGEPWSDRPECACPIISAFLRSWNDSLPDDERDALLRPFVLDMVGTKSTKEIEHRRALMAADWLVRIHTPAWLRLAKLDAQADALAALPEITDIAQVPSIHGAIEAARVSAAAAWNAAGAAARTAAWDALSATRRELQQSALALVHRMIRLK